LIVILKTAKGVAIAPFASQFLHALALNVNAKRLFRHAIASDGFDVA
jgi:hypothetical protein